MRTRWEYFKDVGFPLWWRDVKETGVLIISALVFFCIAVPIGFILTIKERRKKKHVPSEINPNIF